MKHNTAGDMVIITLVGAAVVTAAAVPAAQACFVPVPPSRFCPALLPSVAGKVKLWGSDNDRLLLNDYSNRKSSGLPSPTKTQRKVRTQPRHILYPVCSMYAHRQPPRTLDKFPSLSLTTVVSAATRRPGLLFGSDGDANLETGTPAVHNDDNEDSNDGRGDDDIIGGDISALGVGKRDEENEEEMFKFEPVIDLPVDGVLLQLFPAALIGVFGIVLTILVYTEAATFDNIGVGEGGGNGAVVVKDLRVRTTQ